jgi:hypothetical protein
MPRGKSATRGKARNVARGKATKRARNRFLDHVDNAGFDHRSRLFHSLYFFPRSCAFGLGAGNRPLTFLRFAPSWALFTYPRLLEFRDSYYGDCLSGSLPDARSEEAKLGCLLRWSRQDQRSAERTLATLRLARGGLSSVPERTFCRSSVSHLPRGEIAYLFIDFDALGSFIAAGQLSPAPLTIEERLAESSVASIFRVARAVVCVPVALANLLAHLQGRALNNQRYASQFRLESIQ